MRKYVILLLIFAAALYFFLYLANLILANTPLKVDGWAFQQLKPFTSATVTKIMNGITFFGSTYFLFPAYTILICYLLFVAKNKSEGIAIAFIGLAGNQLWIFAQNFVHRHRPFDPLITGNNGYSFPSGHAFASTTFYTILIWMIQQSKLGKKYKYVCTVFLLLAILFIVTSRVYLHVHYASDVIGGICLSIMWLIFSYILFRLIQKFIERRNLHKKLHS